MDLRAPPGREPLVEHVLIQNMVEGVRSRIGAVRPFRCPGCNQGAILPRESFERLFRFQGVARQSRGHEGSGKVGARDAGDLEQLPFIFREPIESDG